MIRNKIQDITADPMDMKRMIVCCKQLHAHKFDNPDEKVQFLETHYLYPSKKWAAKKFYLFKKLNHSLISYKTENISLTCKFC